MFPIRGVFALPFKPTDISINSCHRFFCIVPKNHWTSEFSSRFEIFRNFSSLVATVSGETTLEIDKVSVFDFLSFRRVHGKYTLFKDLFFLRAGQTP